MSRIKTKWHRQHNSWAPWFGELQSLVSELEMWGKPWEQLDHARYTARLALSICCTRASRYIHVLTLFRKMLRQLLQLFWVEDETLTLNRSSWMVVEPLHRKSSIIKNSAASLTALYGATWPGSTPPDPWWRRPWEDPADHSESTLNRMKLIQFKHVPPWLRIIWKQLYRNWCSSQAS